MANTSSRIDDWSQRKARLEQMLGWMEKNPTWSKEAEAIHAALQRVEAHEERLRQICCGCGESALTHRIDYGQPSVVRQESDDGACGLDQCGEWLWIGADKELVALRQRVEELERAPCGCPVPDCQHHRGLAPYPTWRERAEAAEARVKELEYELDAAKPQEPWNPSWRYDHQRADTAEAKLAKVRASAQAEIDRLHRNLAEQYAPWTPEFKQEHREKVAAIHRATAAEAKLARVLHFMENVPTDAQLDAKLPSGDTGRAAWAAAKGEK